MESRIRQVISEAVKSLPNNLARKCISEGVFMTKVGNVDTGEYLTIVDFQTPMAKDNFNDFMNISEQLYDQFNSIEKWYTAG